MRLPCPVGHYSLLSILGGSASPPSLLTLPLLWADVASCNIFTALLRAWHSPWYDTGFFRQYQCFLPHRHVASIYRPSAQMSSDRAAFA